MKYCEDKVSVIVFNNSVRHYASSGITNEEFVLQVRHYPDNYPPIGMMTNEQVSNGQVVDSNTHKKTRAFEQIEVAVSCTSMTCYNSTGKRVVFAVLEGDVLVALVSLN